MDLYKLQNHMKNERTFLANLYQSNSMQAKKEVLSASAIQIRVLIQVCGAIASGLIHLQRKSFEALSSAKKTKFFNENFSTISKTNKLLKKSRKEQLDILLKLSSVYPHLLFK